MEGHPPEDIYNQPEVVSITSAFTLPPNGLLLLVSGAVAVLGLILFFLLQKKSSSRGSTILLVGPSDAGKTAIFSTLTYKTALPSHTSMQTDTSVITTSATPLKTAKLVDIPGHPRIRATFSDHMADAKAIVFVVDTGTIARNGPAVAEHLHIILNAISSLPPSQTPPQLLIHAHKSDNLVIRSNTPTSSVSTKSQTRQLAKDRTQTILERELEKRRKTAMAGVNVEGLSAVVGAGGATAEAEEVTGGGLECSTKDGTFKFDHWEGGDVQLSAGWVDIIRDDGIVATEKKDGDNEVDGLSELKDWLEGLP